MLYLASAILGCAIGFKAGFFYGFRVGRDDQVVLEKILKEERRANLECL